MEEASANPIVMALLFIGRCLVPVAFLLGISYLLRRFGLIQGPSQEDRTPPDREEGAEETMSDVQS